MNNNHTPAARRSKGLGREVLLEMHRVGNALRVTAIDPVTGTEVIMVADPRQSMETIKQLAARKLAYVIDKNRNKT
ncbi:MAG TPA: hypothetical protein VIN57_03715 [Magnetovibrio sp.]